MLAKLVRHLLPEQANLPYNANWRRSWEFLSRFLDHHPVVIADVGARGGALDELAGPGGGLARYSHMIGFDADEEECARLNASPPPSWKRFDAHPVFIAERDGPVEFHLYKRRGMSSVYRPGARFLRAFTDRAEVERTVTVAGRTLDGFFCDHPHLPAPDMLKLDTQGSELGILRGAGVVLATATAVEVEVEFMEMYQGQPLFHEVMAFMVGHGFEPVYLSRAFLSRSRVYDGLSRGQLAAADVLFARREDRLEGVDAARAARAAVVMTQYGHLDIAADYLRARPDAAALVPELKERLTSTGVGRARLGVRALLAQLDKLAYVILHARRTNQLGHDSDRCYPTR